jgi:hypothetical protein
MQQKHQYLKKVFLRIALMMTAVVLGLAAAGYFMSEYSENLAQKLSDAEQNASGLKAKISAMRSKSDERSKTIAYYSDYIRYYNSDFKLDREKLLEMIATLQPVYRLSHLEISISPITTLSPKAVALEGNACLWTQVNLAFESLDDNVAYRFLQALQGKMPGIVKVSEFESERFDESRLSAESLAAQKTLPKFVRTKLTLEWIGLGPKDDVNAR